MGDPIAPAFSVCHLDEASFRADGLRAYAAYRDLGIATATGGGAVAHVIRMVKPCADDARGWHRHVTEFQMIYVLKGWFRARFEGHGEHDMRVGSCWFQPPGIVHAVVDYSDDCELLEIVMPANFRTIAEP